MPKTDNIPPRYQAVVLEAIKMADERRAQLEADGTLMDFNALVDEIYKQLLIKTKASGVPTDEFIPEHRYYLAAGLRKVVRWALAFSKEHPATHRKGYGEDGVTVLSTPAPLIFFFGGGGKGGPGEGPGGPDWPEPEEWEEDYEDYGGEMPASLESDVAHERESFPAYLQPDDYGKILNAVAWKNREAGWGLSAKPSGNHVMSPQGVWIAYDILHHRPTNTLWGCFTDGRVNWGLERYHGDPDGRPWVAPIQP